MNREKMLNDDLSDKVALLFEECMEIPDPGRRAAFLDTACAGCAELRQQVETLLRAHEASGRFLQGVGLRPTVSPSYQPGPQESLLEPSGRVGPYRLMGLIGEGSTSTVFLAEQEEPVRRWVALKIL